MGSEKNVQGIDQKLSDIQVRLVAPKTQLNKFGNYMYRKCEDIMNAVKPYLKEHELVLLVGDELVQIGDRYYVKATAVLSDHKGGSISISAYARESESKKGMDDSQVTGATSSYARKYALNGLFCIDDNKDADGVDHVEKVQQEANSQGKQGNTEADQEVKKSNGNIITEKQGKRLLAIGHKNGFTHEIIKEYVLAVHGFEHLRDITKDKYEEICAHYERKDGDS